MDTGVIVRYETHDKTDSDALGPTQPVQGLHRLLSPSSYTLHDDDTDTDQGSLADINMAATLARLQRAHSQAALFHSAPSSSRVLLYLPSHRHAMMSALSHDRPAPPPSTSSSPSSSSPLLGETPPVVVPSSSSKPPTAKNLSPDAASPQVAARPPPAPKAERPRPTIRAKKAAITLVRMP